MLVLLVAEAVVLALLVLLVAGLLRGYAELRRELQVLGEQPMNKRAPERVDGEPARPLDGETIDRASVVIPMGPDRPDTLLAFLSSGCLVCHGLWADLRQGRLPSLPVGRIIVVTKDLAHESPSKLRELMPSEEQALVVHSPTANDDYGVPGSPYFVHVDGASGTIVGEGSATSWDEVSSLLRDAVADAEALQGGAAARSGEGHFDRIRRADDELAAAGITTGHPSLYDTSALISDGEPEQEKQT